MNLPGQGDYNPALPWVFKYDSINHKVAAFFKTYVDDIRTGDSTEAACVRSTHATRIEMGGGWSLDRKALDKDRGFLIHIARTFPMMVPYLRRIHNTLESWRLGRDSEGWKYSASDWVEYLGEMEDDFDSSDKNVRRRWKEWKVNLVQREQSTPNLVRAVEGLLNDVRALEQLFSSPVPTKRLMRGKKLMRVVYGFGDASGSGFGGTWTAKQADGSTAPAIKYRFGLWGSDMDSSSSNDR